MSDPRDYKLDFSSVTSRAAAASSNEGRPFIGVQFACCGVYRRIYRDAGGASYVAQCPICGRELIFRVGPGGTNARAFVVR